MQHHSRNSFQLVLLLLQIYFISSFKFASIIGRDIGIAGISLFCFVKFINVCGFNHSERQKIHFYNSCPDSGNLHSLLAHSCSYCFHLLCLHVIFTSGYYCICYQSHWMKLQASLIKC